LSISFILYWISILNLNLLFIHSIKIKDFIFV
jgi:hypothetical protein